MHMEMSLVIPNQGAQYVVPYNSLLSPSKMSNGATSWALPTSSSNGLHGSAHTLSFLLTDRSSNSGTVTQYLVFFEYFNLNWFSILSDLSSLSIKWQL